MNSFSIYHYSILIFTISFLITTPIYLDTVFADEKTIPNHNERDITYVAKFVCGSIVDGTGPLRPGHYNTDISITNKQLSPVSFFWTASVNDGSISHSTLLILDHQESTGFDCRDINRVVGLENSTSHLGGFVFVTIPQNYDIANPNAVVQHSSESINLLDVQVFFTANALDTLPHEVALEKISFYILHDYTDKIPKHMIKTTLDVTLESKLNVITDTERKIKQVLSSTYDISEDEFDDVEIRIKNVSIGVGSMIDDHAISLSIVKPQVYLQDNE